MAIMCGLIASHLKHIDNNNNMTPTKTWLLLKILKTTRISVLTLSSMWIAMVGTKLDWHPIVIMLMSHYWAFVQAWCPKVNTVSSLPRQTKCPWILRDRKRKFLPRRIHQEGGLHSSWTWVNAFRRSQLNHCKSFVLKSHFSLALVWNDDWLPRRHDVRSMWDGTLHLATSLWIGSLWVCWCLLRQSTYRF